MKFLSVSILSILFIAAMTAQSQQSKNIAEQIKTMLNEQSENGWAGSVLVAQNDSVLVEAGYGFADREAEKKQTAATVFSVGSITKQFTAAAILKLESMGKLSTDDKLSKYFPEAPREMANITIHQMLTHTAGFSPALGDDYDAISAKEYMDLVFSIPLNHKPGEQYDYSNVGYSILGIIVEKVSGVGYEKFLRENLWLPTKMNRTGYQFPNFVKEELAVGYRNGNRWGTAIDRPWMLDGPSWHLRANGGVLSNVGDMYRWYQALRKNTVLPKSETEKLFTPFVREDPDGKSSYGYGWVVQFLDGKSLIWHNGGNGAYNANMTFFPNQNICVIVSSNSNNKISDDIALRVLSILLNKPELEPKQHEFNYMNNPVTLAIYEEIMDKGATTFKAESKVLLKNAGFDFKDDMLLLGAGERLLEEGRWEEGQSLYEVYTELFPNIIVAWNHLGKCKNGLGDKAGAKAAWKQSVKLRPLNNPASKWLEEMEKK